MRALIYVMVIVPIAVLAFTSFLIVLAIASIKDFVAFNATVLFDHGPSESRESLTPSPEFEGFRNSITVD